MMQEEEERLTEGTHKFAVFKALKHAGSEGYTLSQISDKIKELGIGDYHDKHKVIANVSFNTSNPIGPKTLSGITFLKRIFRGRLTVAKRVRCKK